MPNISSLSQTIKSCRSENVVCYIVEDQEKNENSIENKSKVYSEVNI